jgi:hypothetical protein
MLYSFPRRARVCRSACDANLYNCQRSLQRLIASMARSRTHADNDDRIARSVLESPGVTANRTRRERRVASGNVRAGQAHAMREIGVVSSSKTGPDRPRNRGAVTRGRRSGRRVASNRVGSLQTSPASEPYNRILPATRSGAAPLCSGHRWRSRAQNQQSISPRGQFQFSTHRSVGAAA